MTTTPATAPEPVRPRRGRPGYDAEALLSKAVTVFTERGYDGTTMDDLAAGLGISKSSIYHHVSGKKELLRRALDRGLDGIEGALASAATLDGTPLRRLEAAVRGSIEVLVRELPFVTLLLRVRGNTDVEKAALTRRRRLDADFAAMVAAAQAAGEMRVDLAPNLVARLVFGTVNSLVEWYRPRSGGGATDLADAVIALTLDGLRSTTSHPGQA